MSFSLTQQKVLSIIPHASGALSILGSGCILKSVIPEIREGKASTYQRLLLGMSCMDCITSFWISLSTWPMPKDTPGVWASFGNTATCTLQGFFVQMMVGVPVYNGSLAIYLLLEGRYNWGEERLRAIEPVLHLIPLTLAVGTAIAGLPLKLFNNADLWCAISPFPLDCNEVWNNGKDCIRGQNAWIYRFAFLYGPVWGCMIIAMVCLLLVYCAVLRQEKEVDKFQQDGVALRKRSRRVAWQAYWYSMAFYSSWLPATVTRILQSLPNTSASVAYPFMLVMALSLPLQGFMNFLVFFRAKYLKYRRDCPDATLIESVKNSAFIRTSQERPLEADDLPDFQITFMPAEKKPDAKEALQSPTVVLGRCKKATAAASSA